jgi:hypothetical protein
MKNWRVRNRKQMNGGSVKRRNKHKRLLGPPTRLVVVIW